MSTDSLFQSLTGHANIFRVYTVMVTLDPVEAQNPRSEGAFGWIGAMGTTSWTDPKEDLVAVILIQQMSPELHYDVANAIRQAIIE
jgi:CubicO group peptidase (beta-lactamase class C family)